MNAIRLIGLGAFLFISSFASADFQWSDNFAWNRARVITPGQHSWSFRTSYQSFDSRFGSSGQYQGLGQPLDRTWTWNQILSTNGSTAIQQSLRRYIDENHLSENDIAAATDFGLKRQETTFEISWAYGLAKRWMIGVQVPISLVTTELSPSTSLTPHLSRALRSAVAPNQTVRQQVESMVQNRLSQEGYDDLQSRSQNWIVGDVSFINQFSLWQNPDWALSLQQVTKIPSAPNNNVADYVRYSRGDGQMDFGLTAMLDHQWKRFLIGGKIGYTKALSDTQKMRVPGNDGTQVIDRSVHRDLGDLISTSLETFYTLGRRWTINGAYLGFFRGADHYSGDSSPEQYTALGADTAQELHLARAGVSYLIGTPSIRHNLENKWVANFNVYQPLAGQNVSEGPQAALELQAFF